MSELVTDRVRERGKQRNRTGRGRKKLVGGTEDRSEKEKERHCVLFGQFAALCCSLARFANIPGTKSPHLSSVFAFTALRQKLNKDTIIGNYIDHKNRKKYTPNLAMLLNRQRPGFNLQYISLTVRDSLCELWEVQELPEKNVSNSITFCL